MDEVQAKICVYCGQAEATTDDHVPPKGLYPEGASRSVLFTVPACRPCNNGLSKDEEWFRLFLATAAHDESPLASGIMMDKIKRSMIREEQVAAGQPLLRGHLAKLEHVDVVTPSGLYTGQRMTKFSLTDEDWKRYHRVLDKIVKGTYFRRNGSILPGGMTIRHFMMNAAWVERQLDLLKTLKFEMSPTFSVGFGTVPETANSACFTLFYECVPFLSLIITDEIAHEWDARKKAGELSA